VFKWPRLNQGGPIETLNHKRIVLRAMTELLGTITTPVVNEQVVAKEKVAMIDGVSMKG